ncbi:MAG: S8 family serine peptidase [Caldilineaceae bacterium]|nr:S8 family serine peptidase [Caldilineaceae bacterium]
MIILILLLGSLHPAVASAPANEVYLPLVSISPAISPTAIEPNGDFADDVGSDIHNDLFATADTLDAASSFSVVNGTNMLYLPIAAQDSGLQSFANAHTDEVVTAAFWGWPLFPQSTTSDYSLNIEKRDFDAGGGGPQINLLLIPGILDLLKTLLVSEYTAKKVWGLTNAEFDEAQSLATGSGVTVAVLDTGISAFPSQIYWRSVAGYDFVGNDPYPYEAPNWRDDNHNGEIDEGAGHGTFVSSIILAATRKAQVMPIRVLNSDGNGTPEAVAEGIHYAADHGAQIINLSLSGELDSDVVHDAIAYAADKGVVIIAAALSNHSQLGFPAGYDSVISVGAIDINNTVSDFTLDNASEVDIFAPGVDIYGPALYGRNVWMSGNSMATAFVSAAAALLMEGGNCDADCVTNTLMHNVKPVSPAQEGRGAVDAYLGLLHRP